MAPKVSNSFPGFWSDVGRRPARGRPSVAALEEAVPGERPLRLAVVGKGGAGKSLIAGTMARLLARRGHRVLALDSDHVPGLAVSLGSTPPATPLLAEAVEKPESARSWRLRKGIGPVRAVQRFSTLAPDGVRVLEVGSPPVGEPRPRTPAVHALYQVVHGLPEARALRSWTMIGDHPAGARQTAYDWAPYADTLLVVAEPTWKSALTARRLTSFAVARGAAALPVASKVKNSADVRRLEEMIRRPVAASVPADEAVATSDRLGVALIDYAPSSPAARAIESLVDRLLAYPTGGARELRLRRWEGSRGGS
jgi:CO dehydrogenase maturation factor